MVQDKSLNVAPLSLKFVGTLGIFGEPPLLHPLLLVEELFDGPERREGKHPRQRREHDVFEVQRGGDTGQSQQQEYPPAAGAPVVLGFDYNRVKQPDDEKGADSDNESLQVVVDDEVHNETVKRLSTVFVASQAVPVVPGYLFAGCAKIKIPVESKTLERELSSLKIYNSLKQLRGAWHTGHL